MCVKISKNELKELLPFSNEVWWLKSIAREKKGKQNLSSSFARRQKNIQPRLLKRCVVVRGRDNVV